MPAKLNDYRFNLSALKLEIKSKKKQRKQRIKIDATYSFCEEILFRVPQRSTQDPCFLIFFCDLFFSMNETDFTSYAENNTPYVAGDSIENVINSLENDSL